MNPFAHVISTTALAEFNIACRAMEIEVPHAVTRALALLDDIQLRVSHPTPYSYLDFDSESAIQWIEGEALRSHSGHGESSRGIHSAVSRFQTGLLLELRQLVLPDLDAMVTSLQPAFDAAVAPIVHGATTYGFSRETDPASVLDMADADAAASYRDMRDAMTDSTQTGLARIARFRILLSRVWNVSPSIDDTGADRQDNVDHSVAFAAGDNFSLAGERYVDQRIGGARLDWAGMSIDGLRLNTPSEAAAKLKRRRAAEFIAQYGEAPGIVDELEEDATS